MKKILLIGCGHMGGALLDSWINSKKYLLTVIDPIQNKFIKKKYNKKIQIFANISSLNKSSKFDYIIFAIKPSDLKTVLDELKNFKFSTKTVVISIIAGKKIKLFKKNFKNLNNFFRVMPNMPASIGKSMNCIVSNRTANKEIKNEVINLFSYSGKTHLLKNENQIDMATAISGSGPGFIFNIIDAMENAAIKLGFNKNTSNLLVAQTFKGSIDLMINNNIPAKNLVKSVATKGGTTEAGIKIMNKNKIHKTFTEVVNASYKKAREYRK